MELLLGAIVSVIVEVVKKKLGTSEYVTLAAVVVLSLVAAAIQFALKYFGFWEGALEILISAGAIYAFIIRRFQK